jgi:hypothetical protein
MHEVSKARIKNGSAGQLSGVPSYNECEDITGIVENIML